MANMPPAELVMITRPESLARSKGHAAWVTKNDPRM
jgi:hypothetical protein